ncbi:MAG: DivIVA domain-containing protein [Actinomycetota bacterium]
MTTSDLDLPIVPSADQIRRREFATIRRGYDPDQVKDYLHQIADQVGLMERELRTRKGPATRALSPGESLAAQVEAEQTRSPAPFGDPYAELGKRFATVIERADREASKVLTEANEEATRILDEARGDADRIRVDAQARAEEARQEASDALVRAREEADRIIGGLSGKREALVTQMQDMQARLLGVAKDLETVVADRDETIDRAVARRSEPQAKPAKGSSEPVDPRYEDLWVSEEAPVDIPDLAPIDLDFDDDSRKD